MLLLSLDVYLGEGLFEVLQVVIGGRARATKKLLAHVAKLHLCGRCLCPIVPPRLLLLLLLHLLLLLPELLVVPGCLREEGAAEAS